MNDYLKMLREAQKVYSSNYPHMRWGQCLFIELHNINPELANGITGSDKDPFNFDAKHERIDVFLEWAHKVLDN